MAAGPGVVLGLRGGQPKPIHSIVDGGGVERLAVDASVTAILDSAISHTDDSILIYGAEDGSGTHRIVNTDSAGRVRTSVQDGQDITQGALADAAATAGGTGSVSAKLRGLSRDLGGTADAAVQGDTAGTLAAKARGLNKSVGQESDAEVAAGATGTLSGKLRGISADLGDTTDAGVVGDSAGSVSAKLRGINRILNDAWDDPANALRVTQETHDEFNANANLQVANVDVSASNRVPVDLDGDTSDLDTGAGVDDHPVVVIGLPASGGHVVGGTDTNPFSVAQNTRGELLANATLQIAGVDAPGGAGLVTASTPRMTLASDDPAVTSLAVLDDWDESDRAKVNPVVGQAGVAAGAGASGVNTQRVIAATDSPEVTALQIIDDWDESDRAKVNPVVGQAGIAAGSGASTSNTIRTIAATDDPGVASLQLIDDAIKTDDAAFTPAIDKVMMAGFVFDDVTPDQVNEGDAGAARMSARREQYTQIRDAAGGERGANVNASSELNVADDQTRTSLAIIDDWDETDRAKVNLVVGQAGVAAGSGASGANTLRTIASSDDPAVVALQIIDDWDETDRAKVNPIVGQAGIAAGAGASGANTVRVVFANDGNQVQGTAAHDAPVSGNPIRQGLKAVNHGAPTSVGNNDTTDWLANRDGVPWVIGGHPNIQHVSVERTDANGAADNVVLQAVAVGQRAVITRIYVSVDEACSAGIMVRVGYGTLGTANNVWGHPGIVPGGSWSIGDGSGMLAIGADDADITFDCDDPVGGSLYIGVSYYLVPA